MHHIDHDSANTVYDNLIVLCRACHDNHHRGEQPDDAAIRYRKHHLIEKTLTQYGINALKMAARRRIGVVAMPYMVFHLVELGYLKQEETQMGYSGGDEYIDVTVRFSITQDGRDLLNRWLAQ